MVSRKALGTAGYDWSNYKGSYTKFQNEGVSFILGRRIRIEWLRLNQAGEKNIAGRNRDGGKPGGSGAIAGGNELTGVCG